jgi:polysaccharide biosynthesis protein PslG
MYESIQKIGVVKSRHAKDIPVSRIGVGFETLDRNLFDPSGVYDPVAACGLKWARCHSGWARTEKKKGSYDFSWLDTVVENLRSRGVEPWLCLCFGNSLYIENTDNPLAWGYPPVNSEEAQRGWAAYIREIVSHYRGIVRYFEIWNEPDGNSYWKPNGANAAEYGIFARDTAKLIKETNPDAVVLGFALAAGMKPQGLAYVKQALDTGMGDFIDFITVHRYNFSPESGVAAGMAALRALIDRYNPKIGLIQGERGCPSRNDGFGAMGQMDWDEEKQAKWLSRMIVTDLAEEYFFTSYFTAVDIPKFPGRYVNEKWAYFGLLREDRYEKKLSYFALQNLCSVFAGRPKSCALPVLFCTSSREPGEGGLNKSDGREYPGFEAYTRFGFALDGKRYFVYWNPVELPQNSFSALTTIFVAGKTGALRLIDPLDGAVYEILPETAVETGRDVRYLRGMPVKDYPLILALDGFGEVQ